MGFGEEIEVGFVDNFGWFEVVVGGFCVVDGEEV